MDAKSYSFSAFPPPLLGRDRDPAPFLEAYPRMSASDAADALGAGISRCLWIWPDGTVFGWAEIRHPSEGLLLVRTKCRLAQGDHSDVVIGVRKAENFSDKRAFSLFACPYCKRNSKQIVLVSRWSCPTCSGLHYRSQAVGTRVRQWDRYVALEEEVGSGRPTGMHHKTYARKCEELLSMGSILEGPRAVAPRDYANVLKCEWVILDASARPSPAPVSSPESRDQSGGLKISPWLGGEAEEL